MIRLLALSLLVMLPVACATAPAADPSASPTPFTGEPRRVIVDTDMAPDDWMAILYLLQRPDVEVEAITVTGAGETHCKPGVRHALGLVALSGHTGIPVACGRETPLQGDHTFPSSWREGVDALLGLKLPDRPEAAPEQTAVELLTSAIESSSQKVTLLTLGPLTNVAEALQGDPSLANKVEMIYIMGGAVDVPGNAGSAGAGIANDVAEWNIYVDPLAASLVLNSGAPITLVPLDATNHAPLTPAFYELIRNRRTTPEAAFVHDLLTKNYSFVQSGSYFFWDPLAAAIVTDESLATFETAGLTVVVEEGPESGRTRRAEDGAAVRIAIAGEGARFEQVFLDALNTQFP